WKIKILQDSLENHLKQKESSSSRTFRSVRILWKLLVRTSRLKSAADQGLSTKCLFQSDARRMSRTSAFRTQRSSLRMGSSSRMNITKIGRDTSELQSRFDLV